MGEKKSESLLHYDPNERTFWHNENLYYVSLNEGIYLISNTAGNDLFYFNIIAQFMDHPAQISVNTCMCKLPTVNYYLWRLNRYFFEDVSEKWVEIWIIALFKNLSIYFGEENLISSSVLDKKRKFHEPSYSALLNLTLNFELGYPDSIVVNFPYTRNSIELSIILSRMVNDNLNGYFKQDDKMEILDALVTYELQLAYSEIHSLNNTVYLHHNVRAIEGVNDAVLIRNIFVVFDDKIPVLAFGGDYEKQLLD
jgi:hypothetical protein